MAGSNKLSDKKIRAGLKAAADSGSVGRLPDGAGLVLLAQPSGVGWWRLRYWRDGKEGTLSLGTYPDVGLSEARQRRDDLRRQVAAGIDPSAHRAGEKAQRKAHAQVAALAAAGEPLPGTFEAVARELHASKKGSAWSENHARQWLRCCEKDLFPFVGALPLAEVTAPLLLAALRRAEDRQAVQLAHDLRQYAGQVFRHGIATGHGERNPAADLVGALKPHTVKHMAAILEPAKAGALLRDMDGYAGQPLTRGALLLSALLFQRPGNIRTMEWAEIDTEAALWVIPASKMKRSLHGKINGRPHLVPLAPQALAVLAQLRPLSGHRAFVFPSLLAGDRCMSENTIRAALRRMGYDNDTMTAHGFRAMARTLIAERLPGVPADVVEAQLAHGKGGPLGMAYDRAEYMEQRRQMMSTWADYLDRLREGAQVLAFRGAA